ncbi:MAG: hypothetical protein NVSMB27_18640 [Ktedonobacteraceae bacterium]
MASLAFAAPLLPGGAEVLRQTAKEAMEARRAVAQESTQRLGVSIEKWYLQSTPQGDMVIVYIDSEDLARAFQTLAASDAPFDVFFKQQALKAHGIDLSKPFPGPLPEQIFER